MLLGNVKRFFDPKLQKKWRFLTGHVFLGLTVLCFAFCLHPLPVEINEILLVYSI